MKEPPRKPAPPKKNLAPTVPRTTPRVRPIEPTIPAPPRRRSPPSGVTDTSVAADAGTTAAGETDGVGPTIPAVTPRTSPLPSPPAAAASERQVATDTTAFAAHEAGLAKFELGGELGRGGMGVVNVATDRALRRELAVKMLLDLSPEMVEQFVEEAQITGQLDHPNIVPVYEMGADESGRPWLAMKRVRGETLDERIEQAVRKRRPLTPASIASMLDIFSKVCDAIAFAHDHGVIHRDLKPENIMLGRHGEVLVMDWGLAKPVAVVPLPSALRASSQRSQPLPRSRSRSRAPLDSGRRGERLVQSDRRAERPDLTVQGSIFGTPAYMAPEQATGEIDAIDTRTDIFALGAVLYHMLTLRPPYDGESVNAVLVQAAQRDLDSPRQRAPRRAIPTELDAIVMKAMAPDPADRYPTVAALQADLAAYRALEPVGAYRPTLIERAQKWARRHPTTSITAALSVAFVATIGAIVSVWLVESATAEAERQRIAADNERLARENAVEAQRAEQAEFLAMAQKGEIAQLIGRLGGQLRHQRDETLQEFFRLHEAAMRRGKTVTEFLDELSPDVVAHTIQAFEALVAAHEKYGAEIPIVADDFYYLGVLSHNRNRDSATAIKWYGRALALDSNHADARHNRGVLLLFDQRFADAEADFTALIATQPGSAEAYNNRATARFHLGRLDEAVADCVQATRVQPNFVIGWGNSSDLRRKSGDLSGALRDAEQAIAVDPAHYIGYQQRGMYHQIRGDFTAAIADYNAALARNPTAGAALVSRGFAHNELANYRAAIADFTAALRLNPEAGDALLHRGFAHEKLGDWRSAEADFRAAIRYLKNSGQAWMALGSVLSHLRDLDGSYGAYTRAVEFDPTLADAFSNRSNISIGRQDFSAALSDLNRAIALREAEIPLRDPTVLARDLTARGIVYQTLDDFDRALADYRRAVAIFPGMWQAWVNMASTLAEIGARAEAKAAFETALGHCPPAHRAELESLRSELLRE